MITLSIRIQSPLTEDDRDLLAGIAVMTVAIANRELGTATDADPSTTAEGRSEEVPTAQEDPQEPDGVLVN